MLESILKIDRQFVNSIIAERAEMQRRRQQKQNGGQEEEHGEEAEKKKVEQEVNEILQMARKGKLPPNDEEKLKCKLDPKKNFLNNARRHNCQYTEEFSRQKQFDEIVDADDTHFLPII